MSEAKNVGGQAFPLSPSGGWAPRDGMSLRDYFAAKVLSAVIQQCAHDTMHGMNRADYFAGRAYEIADAMLAARQS